MSGIGSAKKPSPQRNVEEVTGEDEKSAVGQINSNEDVKTLDKYFRGKDWKIDSRGKSIWEASGSKSKDNFQFAVVPLSPKNKNSDGLEEVISRDLIWNDSTEVERDAIVRETHLRDGKRRLYYVSEGKVHIEETEINTPSTDEGSERLVTDGGCTHMTEECTNVNWSCVTPQLIAAAVCAAKALARAFKEVILCLNGAGWYAIQAIQNETCSWCDNTDIREYSTCGEGWEVSPP